MARRMCSCPPKAVFLAIRFCNPANASPMNETLGGYILDMNRADLLQAKEFHRDAPATSPLA